MLGHTRRLILLLLSRGLRLVVNVEKNRTKITVYIYKWLTRPMRTRCPASRSPANATQVQWQRRRRRRRKKVSVCLHVIAIIYFYSMNFLYATIIHFISIDYKFIFDVSSKTHGQINFCIVHILGNNYIQYLYFMRVQFFRKIVIVIIVFIPHECRP